MAPPGRCIFLTGAPECERLDWSESTLTDDLTIGNGTQHQDDSTQPTPTWEPPKWRAIPFQPNTQSQDPPPPQTQFLPFDSFGAAAEIPELEQPSQDVFLSHSLALLDDLATSQIADQTTFLTTTTSFDSTVTDYSNPSLVSDSLIAFDPSAPKPWTGPITDLRAIPTASHITSIIPQTITLNLLCGVISISPSRTISLKRQSRTMEIQELLLGDETRAGFSVSFWLVPQDSQNIPADSDELRKGLGELRVGDVVVVSNVALSAFRGCVYGQSLGRRWARNSTRVERVEVVGKDGVGRKEGRVFEWVERFVGRRAVGGRKMGGKRAREVGWEEEEEGLPPDTQV